MATTASPVRRAVSPTPTPPPPSPDASSSSSSSSSMSLSTLSMPFSAAAPAPSAKAIVKIAKKVLKRHDSSKRIKVKALIEMVVAEAINATATATTTTTTTGEAGTLASPVVAYVRKVIENSNEFEMEGKKVSLSLSCVNGRNNKEKEKDGKKKERRDNKRKRRDRDDDDDDNHDDDDDDEKDEESGDDERKKTKAEKKEKKKKRKKKKSEVKEEKEKEKREKEETEQNRDMKEKKQKKKEKKDKKKNKRKAKDDDNDDDDDDDVNKEVAVVHGLGKGGGGDGDNDTHSDKAESAAAATKWRKEHGVTLRDSPSRYGDDCTRERRRMLDAMVSNDASYRPWTEFHMASSSSSRSDDTSRRHYIAEPLIRHCVEVRKFVRPSPIQAQSWPILVEKKSSSDNNRKKRDIVGIAETGSGKTLAFALPALTALHYENETRNKKKQYASTNTNKHHNHNNGTIKYQKNPIKMPPRMLVLAPTRELAMQSHDVLNEFGSTLGLTCIVTYGGVSKHEQANILRRQGVDCIVATPGRLKDLINDGSVDLSHVSQLVLDEADRMLDDGFEEDVRFIVSSTMSKEEGRTTAMFSATWPASVAKLAAEYMIDPIRVYVRKDGGSGGDMGVDNDDDDDDDGGAGLSANRRVTQTVEVIDDRARDGRLRELLRSYYPHVGNRGNDRTASNNPSTVGSGHGHGLAGPRVLVFALYKKEAERLEYRLKTDGFNCSSIHGNKTQMARTEALSNFKDGSVPLLVATDVAARGLDIPNVCAVINYTFPLTIEDYIHRIGRTGRAGARGISHTFFQPGDKARAGELQHVLREAGQHVPDELLKFGSTIKKKEHKLYGNFGGGGGGPPMKKATKIVFQHSDDEE